MDSVRRLTAAPLILVAGLIAGTLDITGACVVAWLRAGVTPVRVLQSVASGVYGSASFSRRGEDSSAGPPLSLHHRHHRGCGLLFRQLADSRF